MVGAVPSRYRWSGGSVDLRTYFAMARGLQEESVSGGPGLNVPAMEMTKWFDTNYHYIVPEFEAGTDFAVASTKALDELAEARGLGVETRPVLVGPVTFLLLGKARSEAVDPLALLPQLLPVYGEVLRKLSEGGAEWVQIDEPILVLNLNDEVHTALRTAYGHLREAAPDLRLLLATYFGDLRENREVALSLPVDAVHLDLVRGPDQLGPALEAIPESRALSLGVIDGRNVWRTDLTRALESVERATEALGSDRILVGPSCSLLHSPFDLDGETEVDAELRSWLAFAKQKLDEISILTRAVNEGRSAVQAELQENARILEGRRSSTRTHHPDVRSRIGALSPDMLSRSSPYGERKRVQREKLGLPDFPTTTIGSYPQTKEVRVARARNRSGRLSDEDYRSFLRAEIEKTVRFQEEVGLDVLVHGEFERNDMVEYFGEKLEGFTVTRNGWVQSYGSRGVKPPIIYGDVFRAEPMTVEWSRYAQSLTSKQMKGMLTGPVTILQWSFVRDDQPRSETCQQIALAIRDEVADLEGAGISIIQVDEPALREGLPLRDADRPAYLKWAVDSFRLASAGVDDATQIHTHMCYSEFNDIIDSIAALDADVTSIEGSRSQMELLDAFVRYQYPNEIGPGVYDIHSPRVPGVEEMEALLEKALKVLSSDQLWINPDCGLKTRGWEEVRHSLSHLVEAARHLRAGRPA
jgi:5-methyltetrahydropteroyltriglutamate--homocysteine methyltransferase